MVQNHNHRIYVKWSNLAKTKDYCHQCSTLQDAKQFKKWVGNTYDCPLNLSIFVDGLIYVEAI